MEVVRLYDPARRPANWTEIVQPHQLVIFASNVETGAPTDDAGRPVEGERMTCTLADSMAEAVAHCNVRVAEYPNLRFDVFDAAGRVNPPLLVVVHPSEAARLESSPRGIRIRKWAAVGLLLGAPPLAWYDYAASDGVFVLPTFLALSMVLIAGRLFFMNYAVREAERSREARLRAYEEHRDALVRLE